MFIMCQYNFHPKSKLIAVSHNQIVRIGLAGLPGLNGESYIEVVDTNDNCMIYGQYPDYETGELAFKELIEILNNAKA